MFGFDERDVWSLFHSMAFDFSVWEIWGALVYGGRVVVVPYTITRSPAELLDLLVRERVTVLNQTPSAFRSLIEADRRAALPPEALALRYVIFGGEALSFETLRPWFDRHGDARPQLVNMYGITETTVHVTFRPLSQADLGGPEGSPVPTVPSLLGRPIPDLQIHLLDRRGGPVPPLVPGEIHVGGAGLARGYLERPALTAERFLPDPFSGRSGARLYRSGDLARRLPGGEIEYLGRTDHQVKVRGFRIELGEIEAAISSHPQVAEAAVLARGSGEESRLVAWVAPARVLAAELRRHLRDRLPDYMVPAEFVFLDALPLTANGKLDRRALPEPAGEPGPSNAAKAAESAGLRTPAEELIAGIWAGLLDRERVGRDDDFFELGGHSLLAARLVSRLRAAFGVELPLETVFKEPTVAALAAAVEAASRTPAPPLVPRSPEAEAPLSPAQERLWFLDRLEPGNPAYNVPLALRLSGPVSAPALAAALAAVAARHEVLRATFAELAGQPAQEIAPEARFPLTVVDLTGIPAAARPSEAARQANAEARRPFDLAAGPLCRAALLRLDREEHLLALDVHHIAFDGGSAEILLGELGLLYAGTPLPPLPVQYGDFALWQRAWLDGPELAAELGAWRERLAGAPAALDLPVDRRRPAVQTFRGGAVPVRLPAELVRGLRALGRRHGATLFMTVLAGWSALLHRASGAPEVVVGSPVANRRRPELEGLIGLFVNTLPLRVHLASDPPFTELVDRVRATALAAYAGQDVPFERLIEVVETGRDLSRSPLFQVMLALADGAAPALRLPGVTAFEVPLHNGTAKFELLLALNGREGGLEGGLEFNADLFDAATARRLADRFARLLAGAVAAPQIPLGDLPLLDAAEERQVLVDWNATEAPFPRDLGLYELFEAQAARTPRATALIHGEQRVTYGELDAWAGRLAERLRALGVGPEVLVGVFCGRTPALVAAALAVQKAGGAYLPLDPAYPADRLAYLLADSGAPVVLAEEGVAGKLPAFPGDLVFVDDESGSSQNLGQSPGPGERPRGFVHPEQAAYAIYTSGSTGAPKGVIVRHGSAVNRITWALSAYGPEVLSGVLAATSLCFDLSVFEIFAPLAAGGTVILAEDALALPDLPAASSVTLVNTVPSAITELARAGAIPGSVRVVNLAGEPLRRDLAARLYAFPGIEEVHNLYGPSEDTTYSTGARVERADEREPAIGRPLPNTRIYLLDSRFRPVPAGAPGELWIGGAGLARGYLRRPDLTADRFRPDPFGPSSGGRLYRTGDLARQRTDGTLDYLGRLDHQVKVRGFRIELGEIEAALLAHPEVREAAVLALADGDGKRLVACVAPETVPPAELRRHLAELLPGFMVPAAFLGLPQLPLTPNGKVDRRALEGLAPGASGEERGEYVASRNALEEVLAPLWAEILGLDRVGVLDDFFALGGSSLAGVRLVSRVRELVGVRLPVRQLFLAPTVAGMAEILAAEMVALAGDDLLDEIDAEVLHG
ncbi:MAG TPA: amino acid adenylation domain-containing protein [Thermoanaerobaculia bacterium]|nr:amino acid adenylation domain-containing protein [Thermoanaerobaculia bacterium]